MSKFLQHEAHAIGLDPQVRRFIIQQMTAPHRHYHTAAHLALMKRYINRAFDRSDYFNRGIINRHYNSMMLATLFHDIVYNPTAPDNEEQSAFELKMRVPADEYTNIALAEQMILATKAHDLSAVDNFSNEEYYVTKLFLKADLSVLWSTPTTYAWYARGVRQEYRHVSNQLYREGRSAVLAKLANQIQPHLGLEEIVALTANVEWEKKNLDRGLLDV